MNNAQHTPGPWNIRDKSAHPWVIKCETSFPGVSGEVCSVGYKPNARLIAAAPELLESLKYLLNYENIGAYDRADVVKAARAAIAKAEGK